ncbi:MAG: DUF4416 family protein [Candidatus Omnitrophota bacterium]
MGEIFLPNKTKLICGFIFRNQNYYTKAKNILENKFGRVDFESNDLAFIYTKYYEDEFGKNLIRKFASFKKLINPKDISRIKIFTNKIEQKLAIGARRSINIDPGYIDLAKLILATTKNYSHRIYLNRGIFAEITLTFKNNTFNPNPLTYSDYTSQEYIKIFNEIRNRYYEEINKKDTRATP